MNMPLHFWSRPLSDCSWWSENGSGLSIFAIIVPIFTQVLGDGVMATHVALDHDIGVRLPVPQPTLSRDCRFPVPYPIVFAFPFWECFLFK